MTHSIYILMPLFFIDTSFTEYRVEGCECCGEEGGEDEEEVEEGRPPLRGVHLGRPGQPPGEQHLLARLVPLTVLPVNTANTV